ncbi:transposase [Cucumis melo var. makuwa]|uniref:Transposase n=1 Tax=Cucumis melo var. makuwa TaxID=1194695 RepID=A0A5D3DSK3_CUCMM|nr:transposase [Cucumis melo var. makuwa]TYK26335.1 transposase [Cucumis melo var. makuwa]
MTQVGRHGISCEDQPEPAEGNSVVSVAVGVVAEVALQPYLLPKEDETVLVGSGVLPPKEGYLVVKVKEEEAQFDCMLSRFAPSYGRQRRFFVAPEECGGLFIAVGESSLIVTWLHPYTVETRTPDGAGIHYNPLEQRNLRLALSADGVNPHGPKQPGDDIGTNIAPLIEDLKLLWKNGVECYDAYQEEDEISMNTDSSSVNRHYSNDVLTQALGTKEHNSRVRGVGGYVTPTTYFHSETDLVKMPTEKEVVCESTSTLPLKLKSILRYAEKVMEKDSSITFSLPTDLFGISRKSSVLREDIINLCNMNEVKTFTLVAYMMYLYSSVLGSKENVQLMVSKANQVVLAPFNPVGSTACEYYVMKYMREIVNRGSIVISNSAELDEVRVELVEFLDFTSPFEVAVDACGWE